LLAGEIHAPGRIRLVEVDEPRLAAPSSPSGAAGDTAEGEILFQPELACLCGSDLPFFERALPEFQPVLGHSLHEMIGTVAATSGNRFRPGDRVLCVPVNQVGLFQRFRVSQRRAIPLDPRPAPEHALMAQPLGTVLYALRKLPNLIGARVAVVGQGPMGQLFNAALRNLGARQIIGIDRIAARLEVSRPMGATHVVDASCHDPRQQVEQLTGGARADVVVEAVGHSAETLNLAIDLCRKFGHLLVFGVPNRLLDGLELMRLFRQNLTVLTSVEPDFDLDFPLAMQWIAEERIDVSPILTHRFPLAQIQQAFEQFHQRRDGALKVLIDFPPYGNG
jgi:threonine dehydrogenase-like Zn-dependent dehydrogenase